ncbi:hypothetical protein Tco_0428567 [Tanacetum coccineum]
MNCSVVVEAMVEGFRVIRIHVDGGSSSEVMYEHCFRSLSYRTRLRLRESRIPLNVDIFAWTPADMTGIPRAITEHSLDTYPHIEPNAQKKRSLASDRRKVMTDKVNEWLKAGIVRWVRYPMWVANPMLVKKMTKKDEEKTAFHTEEGVFCYTKMPFGLKNAGADRGKPRSVCGRYGD